MKRVSSKERFQKPKDEIFARIDPENPTIVHLSENSRTGSICNQTPNDRLVTIRTDSKSLSPEIMCQNCNAKI